MIGHLRLLIGILPLVGAACSGGILTTMGREGARTTEPAGTYEQLVERLRDRGEEPVRVGEVEPPYFDVPGRVLALNGADIQVFEYADAGSARDQAATISSDGSIIGATLITWMGEPHFFHSGRLIVLYVGEDPGVLDLLEATLGPPIAGG